MSDKQRKDIHNSGVPLVCQSCEARHGGICGALSEENLVELSRHTKRSAHSKDTPLHSLEAEDGHLANILGGVVKLTKILPDGRQQIVGLQFAPDFLGRPFGSESSIVAEAATDVRLCQFPRSVVERIIRDSPDMEHRLHQQILRELDEAREWMLTLGRKNAQEKVASFLVMIATHIDPERDAVVDSISIDLPLKRADIADFLGLTIETVSRQITNLRKKGVIEVNERKSILITNLDRLAQIANDSG